MTGKEWQVAGIRMCKYTPPDPVPEPPMYVCIISEMISCRLASGAMKTSTFMRGHSANIHILYLHRIARAK